jgi:hypothetical protein
MKLALTLIVLAIVGYVVMQWSKIIETKDQLNKRIVEQLDIVDDTNQPEIRKKLVDDAGKLGVELSPNNIYIAYKDTDVRSVAQQFTANIATFINKRTTIHVSYTARLIGIPLHEEIEESAVRQIQAQQRQSSDLNQILEGPSR